MMKHRRFAALAMALAMAAGTLSGCSSTDGGSSTAENTGDTIVIGAIGPLTGSAADYGITATNGLKLAVEEVNAAGGVLGKQVVVSYQDDEGDTTKSLNAYNLLMDEGAVAIWGPVTSKPSITVANKAASDGTPMMTPTGTATAITEAGSNIFRTCFLDETQATTMADYAADELGAATAAVLYDITDDYSLGLAEAFQAQAEANGMTVVAYESFQNTDTDFKSQLSKIAAADPDVLYVPAYYNTDALIAMQASEVGVDATLLGGDGWDGVLGALDASNYGVVEGAVFTNHFLASDSDEKVQDFTTRYREAYGSDPSSFAALGYDAGMMLFQAIEAAGTTDAAAVTEALANIQYDGVTGSIHYEGSGDPVKEVKMVTVQNGAYALIGDEAAADAESEEAPAEESASEAEPSSEEAAA